MGSINRLGFLLCFTFIISTIYAQEWELKKDEQGIKAFTRDYPSLKFNEYLVTTTINAELKSVIAAFTDFSKYDLIYPETKNFKVLKEADNVLISYLRIKTPFPAKDRDGIFKNVFTFDKANNKIHVDVSCITDEYETEKGLVRIPFCKGSWDFVEVSPGKVDVRHQFITDPGGFAPAFIVNAKTVNNPFMTLQVLRELSVQKEYNQVDSKYTKNLSAQ